MNELITINSPITSMQIAEITGKRHDHILRDIKDESEKLEKAGISTKPKFGVRARMGITGEIPYYELSKEGVIQLAARYDAAVRAKLIELVMRQDKPRSALDALAQTVQVLQEQNSRILSLETTQQSIKEAVISEPDNWREEVNRKMNAIAKAIGQNKYQEVRSESYKLLEKRAGVNLDRRLFNKRARMLEEGRGSTSINKANKLDIIDEDKKLREIYEKLFQSI